MSADIRAAFARAKAENRAAFVPFVTAGYPTKALTVPLMLAMQAAGADLIELGIPFSDPLADGGTVQYATTVALSQGVTFDDCMALLRQARAEGLRVPVILMGYVNPLLSYGEEKAVRVAKEAGANGFIVVDLPLEEGPRFLHACREHGLSFVPLVAPNSRDARLPMLVAAADSFLYCVAVAGVTGQRRDVSATLPDMLARIRRHTDLPLAVGFGISTREHFQHVEKIAEGVVIGSAVIQVIRNAASGDEINAVVRFIHEVTGRAVATAPASDASASVALPSSSSSATSTPSSTSA